MAIDAEAPTRRRILQLAGCGAGSIALAGACAGCGNPTGSPPTGPVSAGNVSALTVGSLMVMSNVIIARDAGGLYAMSAVCTHAGCLLNDNSRTIAAGLTCPCHQSIFDGTGAVTRGPARSPLQHYAVAVAADGSIIADGSQPVDASTRLPVD